MDDIDQMNAGQLQQFIAGMEAKKAAAQPVPSNDEIDAMGAPELQAFVGRMKQKKVETDPKLAESRQKAASLTEEEAFAHSFQGAPKGLIPYSGGERLAVGAMKNSIPFGSAIWGLKPRQNYEEAKEAIANGTANQRAYDTVAAYERLTQAEGSRTTGQAVTRGLASLPAMLGETMATAGFLPGGAKGASAVMKYGVRNAASTALAPSLVLPGAEHRAREQGGEVYDPKNLAPAYLEGLVSNAIMSGGSGLGKQAIGKVPTLFARTGLRTAKSIGEQQAADTVTSLVDELHDEKDWKFKTGYGVIGEMAKKDGHPFQRLAVQAATFYVANGIHGLQGEERAAPLKKLAEAADALHETGVDLNRANQILADAQRGLEPPLPKEAAKKVAEYGQTVAELSIPKTENAPAAEVPADANLDAKKQEIWEGKTFKGEGSWKDAPPAVQDALGKVAADAVEQQVPRKIEPTTEFNGPEVAGDAFRKVFEGATGKGGTLSARFGDTNVFLEHNHDTGAVRLDFTDAAGRPMLGSGKEAGVSQELRPGSLAFLRKMRDFVGQMKEAGQDVEYTAKGPQRAELYKKVMERAGFTLAESEPDEFAPYYRWSAKPIEQTERVQSVQSADPFAALAQHGILKAPAEPAPGRKVAPLHQADQLLQQLVAGEEMGNAYLPLGGGRYAKIQGRHLEMGNEGKFDHVVASFIDGKAIIATRANARDVGAYADSLAHLINLLQSRGIDVRFSMEGMPYAPHGGTWPRVERRLSDEHGITIHTDGRISRSGAGLLAGAETQDNRRIAGLTSEGLSGGSQVAGSRSGGTNLDVESGRPGDIRSAARGPDKVRSEGDDLRVEPPPSMPNRADVPVRGEGVLPRSGGETTNLPNGGVRGARNGPAADNRENKIIPHEWIASAKLSPFEREVLTARAGTEQGNASFESLAAKKGLSKQWIAKVEKTALEREKAPFGSMEEWRNSLKPAEPEGGKPGTVQLSEAGTPAAKTEEVHESPDDMRREIRKMEDNPPVREADEPLPEFNGRQNEHERTLNELKQLLKEQDDDHGSLPESDANGAPSLRRGFAAGLRQRLASGRPNAAGSAAPPGPNAPPAGPAPAAGAGPQPAADPTAQPGRRAPSRDELNTAVKALWPRSETRRAIDDEIKNRGLVQSLAAAGLDPAAAELDLHHVASDTKKEHDADVKEHNKRLQTARAWLQAAAERRGEKNWRADRKEDWIGDADIVARSLQSEYPGMFQGTDEGAEGSHSFWGDQLVEMLNQGNRQVMPVEEAYGLAHDQILEAATAAKAAAQREAAAQKVGFAPQAVESSRNLGRQVGAALEEAGASAGEVESELGDAAEPRRAGTNADFNPAEFGANDTIDADWQTKRPEPGPAPEPTPGSAGRPVEPPEFGRPAAGMGAASGSLSSPAPPPGTPGASAPILTPPQPPKPAGSWFRAAKDFIKSFAQKSYPALTRLSREAGEHLAEASNGRPAAESAWKYLSNIIKGGDGIRLADIDSATDRELGVTWLERRTRVLRDNLDEQYKAALAKGDGQAAIDARLARDKVRTFVGQPGSPLQSEQQYQDNLHGLFGFFESAKQHWTPEVEKNYRSLKGLAPDDEIDSPSQIPQLPLNAIAVDPNAPGAVAPGALSGPKQGMGNLRLNRPSFMRQASLASEAYDISLKNMMQRTLAVGIPAARRAEFVRSAVKDGVIAAVEGGDAPPAGFKYLGLDPAHGLPGLDPKARYYVHPEAYRDVVQGLGIGERPAQAFASGLKPAMDVLYNVSLMSPVELATHVANHITALFRPGMGTPIVNLKDTFKNGWDLYKRDPEILRKVSDLAAMSASFGHEAKGGIAKSVIELGKYLPGVDPEAVTRLGEKVGKYDPTTYINKFTSGFIDVMQKAVRVQLGDAYDKLSTGSDPKFPATETAKRDFINQAVGNYNTQAGNRLAQFLKDSGLQSFATAAHTFTTQGVKATFGGAINAPATSPQAALQLRAVAALKLLPVLAIGPIINLMQDEDAFPEGVPAFAVKTGEKSYFDPLAFTGQRRGARATGLSALIEGSRKGQTAGQIGNRAVGDLIHSGEHLVAGPPVQTAHTLLTGEDAMGHRVVPFRKPGQGEDYAANAKAAALGLNPVVKTVTGADRPKKPRTWLENIMQSAGPFGEKKK